MFYAGLPQCFSNTNCTGAVVDAADQRDCCVGTDDGLSYHNGTNCHLCIGMFLTLAAHARTRGIALGLCVRVCVSVRRSVSTFFLDNRGRFELQTWICYQVGCLVGKLRLCSGEA